MATLLQQFREQHPQYNHIEDDELGDWIHEKYYSTLARKDFRQQAGLRVEPIPEPPSTAERLDAGIAKHEKKRRASKPLASESGLDEFTTGPNPDDLDEVSRTYWDDQAQNKKLGFISNTVTLTAGRVTSLVGHAISGVIGRPGQAIDALIGSGHIVFGSDWGPGDPADGKFRVRYMNAQEHADFQRDTKVRDVFADILPGAFKSIDFGGEARNTPQEIKEAYHRGEILGTIGATLKFGLEVGITSIPDILMVMSGLPGMATYFAIKSDEMGDVRAVNKQQEVATFKENLEAMPAAIGSVLFERFGASKIIAAFGKKTVEGVGNDIIQAGLKAAAKRAAERTGVALIAEGGTEAFQEGAIEYLGEKLGTGAPLSWEEAVERGFFGFLGGATFGGAVGGGLAVGGEVTRALDNKLLDEMESDFEKEQEPPVPSAPEDPDIAVRNPFSKLRDAREKLVAIGEARGMGGEYDAPGHISALAEWEQAIDLVKEAIKTGSPEMAKKGQVALDLMLESVSHERYMLPQDPAPTAQETTPGAPQVMAPDPEVLRGTQEEVFDVRLKREPFRVKLAEMADNALTTLVASAGNLPASAMVQTAVVQTAVRKALTGQLLGVGEARIVQNMLDEITGHRRRAGNIDKARAQLERARANRRSARMAAELPPTTPQADQTAGEIFAESEYLPGMDGDARIVDELAAELDIFGPKATEQVQQILKSSNSTQAAMVALEALLNEHQTATTRGEGPPLPQTPISPPEIAPQPIAPERRIEGKPRDTDQRTATDRRINANQRARVAAMSIDELVTTFYTDPLTGLGNRRAFEEVVESADAIGSIDIDGLSGINDNLGHDAGDALIRAVGEALDNTGLDAYHISGDEFYVLGDNPGEVATGVETARKKLASWVLETDKGQLTGIEITAGIAETKADADTLMEQSKVERLAQGIRVEKGLLPKNGTLKSTRILNSKGGSNYVGIIGRAGNLPYNANHEYVLGNGETVKIPDKPVRRKHIMAVLQRKFGVHIFQGRVKGAKLGFYRPGTGQIRIKFQNDLEVTAHEVSHWLDDRYPWIGRLYSHYKTEMKGVSYDVTKIYEGYAEFMRLWFTQEHMAREAAPGFYDAWMAAVKERPELSEVVMPLQQLMHAWHIQGARARLEDRYGRDDISFIDRANRIIDKAGDYLLRQVFDEIRPFKVIERHVRTAPRTSNLRDRLHPGQKAPGVADNIEIGADRMANAAFSAYKNFRLARGAHGLMQAMVYRGTFNWGDDGDIKFTGDGLKAVFDPVSHKMTEMLNYMVARRAQELSEQGRENHVRPDEIRRGLQFGEEDPQLAKVFDEWRAFNSRMLDFYESSGLISSESRAVIDEMNKNYVPFNRIIDTLSGEKVRRGGSTPFMRLKGGTGNIADIFESIIGNNTRLVQMALINQGKRSFYQMLSAADNQTAGMYAEPLSRDVKPTQIQKEQVIKAVVTGLGLTMKWYRSAQTGVNVSKAELDLVVMLDRLSANLEPMVQFWKTGVEPKGEDVDYYFLKGEKQFWRINDDPGVGLMAAIQSLGPRPYNLALSILGGFANVMRRGVTLTPTFQAKNFIRDTMNAFTLSKGQIVPVFDATKALVERLYNDEHYWEYLVNGGGFSSMADAEGINRDRVLDSGKKIFHALDTVLATAEYANRIGEFKKLREKGWRARDAALAGREISTDFAMRGASDVLRWFTVSVPFMNAHLQGGYRNAREIGSLKEGRLKFAGLQAFSYALRALMAITLPSLVLYAFNKDDPRYQEFPDWLRDLFWIIFYGPGEDDYVLIPKPFETGMLWGTIPERAIEYYYKRDLKELADAMLWMVLETFSMNPIPQAYRVWDDLQKNKDFTGAPIIPEFLKGVDAAEQYRAYTSDAMIALGRKIGYSPIKAEYIVRGHFATLGTWALGLADMLVGDINNSGAKPTKDWEDNILMSPFVNNGPLRRTHSERHLYDMLKETQVVANTIRLISQRSPERYESYISQPKKQVFDALNSDLRTWATEMRDLKLSIDMIRADPDLSGLEKQQQIFELQRVKNTISRAVRQNINPIEVQKMIDEVEAADIRSRLEAKQRANGR